MLGITAIVTAPGGIFGSTTVRTFVFIFELLDVGYSLYDAYSQIAASDAEIEFASGASVVIGEERYSAAKENAQTWIGEGLGVAIAAFGVATSAYDVLPKLVALRRIARGRHLVRSINAGSGIAGLQPADLQDFRAFAIHAYSKSLTDGAEALTSLEKRVVGFVDELRQSNAARPVAAAASDAAVLANAAPDDFTPSSPVRFDPDPDSPGGGNSTVRPPQNERIETPQVSGDIPNSFESRVPDGAYVEFTDAVGGIGVELPLGRFLGDGATSEVFAHGAYLESRAIRITYVDAKSPAAIADRFGDDVLRNVVRSEHIRPVEIFADYPVSQGEFGGRRISRITEVEQLEGTAWDSIRAQGGKIRIAQLMAMDGALTDLNTRGYVWLDNKGNNFGFADLTDGSGRVQIVVMDPGGIYKIRPGAGAAFGLTDSQLARRIQLRVNGDFAGQLPDYAYIGTPKYRTAIRRDTLMSEFGDVFDFEAMGLSGPSDIRFNPRSGEDFGELTPIFEAVD